MLKYHANLLVTQQGCWLVNSTEFYFRDLPPLCWNYELTSTYDMHLGAHKCEM